MPQLATGAIALEDGTIFWGHGHGATGVAAGELCFNTAMTGYQEILTDPSYAEQIVLFTFPHIGNVGANADDQEESSTQGSAGARGAVFRATPTLPASWRSADTLDAWLKKRGIIGLSGVDTRALTRRIRELGMPKSAIAFDRAGKLDGPTLIKAARDWKGIENADLAINVSSGQRFESTDGLWSIGPGFAKFGAQKSHVVLIDYGVKKNILRNLSAVGARVTVVPARPLGQVSSMRLTAAEPLTRGSPPRVAQSDVKRGETGGAMPLVTGTRHVASYRPGPVSRMSRNTGRTS